MTTHHPSWRDEAACIGHDTGLFFGSANAGKAQAICERCPVRAECLYEQLQREANDSRYGVFGGLTAAERRALPSLPDSRPAALALLREEFANRTTTSASHPADRKATEMTSDDTTPPAEVQPAPVPPLGKLLHWADAHVDASVRDQAALAGELLEALRSRYAADQELTAISDEAAQLEKRLAEIRAREAELAPKKPGKAKRPLDYPAAEVRAWARENSVDCSATGRVPKAVVDAWRAATRPASGGDE